MITFNNVIDKLFRMKNNMGNIIFFYLENLNKPCSFSVLFSLHVFNIYLLILFVSHKCVNWAKCEVKEDVQVKQAIIRMKSVKPERDS